MELKLKSCPFCGGEAELCTGQTGDGKPWPYVECIACAGMAEPNIWNNRAASPPEAAGRGDGWARGVRDALRVVQEERLERHEELLLVDVSVQDGDAAYSSAVNDCERAITDLLETAGAPPSGEQSQPSVNQGEASEKRVCILCHGKGWWIPTKPTEAQIQRGRELAAEYGLMARTDAVNEGEKNVESTASGVVPFDTSTAGGTRSPLADEVAPGPQEGREP